MMSLMMKRQGEPNASHARSEGAGLRSRRKRVGGSALGMHRDSNENFLQAFADALRDILRDEGRRAA